MNKAVQKRKERRAAWIASQGGKCIRCGSTADLRMHHRDPEQKESHEVWGWSAERLAVELAKCDLVCDPCHRRIHVTELASQALSPRSRQGPPGHVPSISRYRQGCRCVACLKVQASYKARERKSRAERKAAGVLKEPSWAMKKYLKRREAGICVKCAKPHNTGMFNCRDCQDRENAKRRLKWIPRSQHMDALGLPDTELCGYCEGTGRADNQVTPTSACYGCEGSGRVSSLPGSTVAARFMVRDGQVVEEQP